MAVGTTAKVNVLLIKNLSMNRWAQWLSLTTILMDVCFLYKGIGHTFVRIGQLDWTWAEFWFASAGPTSWTLATCEFPSLPNTKYWIPLMDYYWSCYKNYISHRLLALDDTRLGLKWFVWSMWVTSLESQHQVLVHVLWLIVITHVDTIWIIDGWH